MEVSQSPRIELLNVDCMEYMAGCEDNQFDLAIVDPPYGIGIAKNGSIGGNNLAETNDYGTKGWDAHAPKDEYFYELIRVSKNQIIWGANHFISRMPLNSSCWIVWNKDNSGNFADCELAYTSFQTAVRMFQFRWNGMLQGDMKNKEVRIHPTQKPTALYKWLLTNYAHPGDKILDTHSGGLSIGIACLDKGFDLTACELDKDYFDASIKRLRPYLDQMKIPF